MLGLHGRRLQSFDEMTDLPKNFREKLNETATVSTLTAGMVIVSSSGEISSAAGDCGTP